MHTQLTEQQAFLILNALPNIGPISTNRLLAHFNNDPLAIFSATKSQLQQVRGIGPAASDSIANWQTHFDLPREEQRMAAGNITFLTQRDPAYPKLLREINDPPVGLYRKGNYDFSAPAIAIVGTRRTTLYGQATAKKLAAELARAGFCIVSGLARGIDTAAHEGALSVNGKTAAVLGTGIDIIYPPENIDLFKKIESTGAILSEFTFGRRADIQSFAMRNRIVSGICEAVVVVESAPAGGSMITARFAGEQGRLLFAVPGRIDQSSSAGCHQLIRDGATLLTSVDDILSELNYLNGLRPTPIPNNTGNSSDPANTNPILSTLTPEESLVFQQFQNGTILTPDQLASQTNLPSSQLSPILMMLELKRLIQKRLDGTYEPKP